MALAMALGAAGLARAQQPGFVLDLRSGRQLEASELRGDFGGGLEAVVGGARQRIDAGELLAVRVAAAAAPDLLQVQLAGGDTMFGALAGGDDAGDRLELLSPALGKVAIATDRLVSLRQPGVHASVSVLPEGVDEGVFVETSRGFDLVAGALHRFGVDGILFQPDAADAPRWFAAGSFAAMALRGAVTREEPAAALLVTRTADRVGVTPRSSDGTSLEVEMEGGGRVRLRWSDVACLVFGERTAHLSDLEPIEVVERGFDGGVLYPFRRDAAAVGGELNAGGRTWGRGLGVHSMSRITFRVPDDATHFRTRVALDDGAASLPLVPHAVARVLVGDRAVFEAKELVVGSAPADSGLLPVRPGDVLTLEVDFGRGRDLGDRVDWLMPVFLLRSQS